MLAIDSDSSIVVKWCTELVKGIMESAEGLCAGLATSALRVPLRVTLSTGTNWAHLQQYPSSD